MTEITRVPLQPIARGSLAKMWIGVAVAVIAAIALAFWLLPRGVEVDVIEEGTGASPGPDDVAFIRYTGTLADGTVFDQSQDIQLPVEGIFPEGTPLPLDGVVPGFAEGLQRMRAGGRYELFIPARLAYGEDGQPDPSGQGGVPPNSDLNFEVELVEVMSRGDFEGRIARFQQALEAQQGAAGPPGGEGAAPPPGVPAPAPVPAQ